MSRRENSYPRIEALLYYRTLGENTRALRESDELHPTAALANLRQTYQLRRTKRSVQTKLEQDTRERGTGGGLGQIQSLRRTECKCSTPAIPGLEEKKRHAQVQQLHRQPLPGGRAYSKEVQDAGGKQCKRRRYDTINGPTKDRMLPRIFARQDYRRHYALSAERRIFAIFEDNLVFCRPSPVRGTFTNVGPYVRAHSQR